jgi:hypothetical protein
MAAYTSSYKTGCEGKLCDFRDAQLEQLCWYYLCYFGLLKPSFFMHLSLAVHVSLALEMIDLILFFCTTGVLCSNLVFLSTSLWVNYVDISMIQESEAGTMSQGQGIHSNKNIIHGHKSTAGYMSILYVVINWHGHALLSNSNELAAARGLFPFKGGTVKNIAIYCK